MEFDYVIVGGGSGGCVLASRLSEDPDTSVLLLEAGTNNDSLWINMPAAFSIPMSMNRFNWKFLTEPEPNLNNRRITCPRGKGLGGSSAINGMAWVRGNPLDYEGWSKFGATGWTFNEVLPYFLRAEHYSGGSDTWRGRDGPVAITRGHGAHPLYQAFVNAGEAAGYELTKDPNGYRQEGFGPMDMSVGNGQRSSTKRAYLNPALNRSNLKVWTQTLAKRVVIENRRVIGVLVHRANKEEIVSARREVIVSAGAIGSPQLLMCSGIGPADHLQELGICVALDLPGVGSNLMDHLELYIQQACSKPITLYSAMRPLRRLVIGMRWLMFKNGLGATNHFEVGAFIRSRPGIRWPNIQYHFLPMAISYDGKNPANQHAYQVHVGPMRSKSRGSIRLRSNNPFEAPVIRFNYMSHEDDWTDFRACVRLTREILNQTPFDPYRGKEIAPGPSVQTDAEIDSFVRERVESAYHPCGTCRMGSKNDPYAVTNSHGQVHGIAGLRVADASIMPLITTGNLNAPVIMMAEKIADSMRGKSLPPIGNVKYHQTLDWKTVQR